MRKFWIALLLLAPVAHAGTLADLEREGVVVLYQDYRSGSLHDFSGNGNDGTATNLAWNKQGLSFPASTSKVTVADSAELQLTEGTLIVYSADGFLSQTNFERLISKTDAGGTNYRVYLDNTHVTIHDGVAGKSILADITGKHYVSMNFTSGETSELFIDGTSAGSTAGASTFTSDDAELIVGAGFTGTANQTCKSSISAALIINRKLTAPEHAALYAELAAMHWPSSAWGRAQGTYGAELVTNGDFETGSPPTGWISSGGTFTSESGNVLAGSHVGRVAYNGVTDPYIYQANVFTIGKTYRVTGWAHGDGTAYPRFYSGQPIWNGTTASAWQKIDIVFTSTNVNALFFARVSAAGYAEFDNISVREVITPEVRFKTDWGTHDIANIAPGSFIPGTEAKVESGAYKIVTETVDGHLAKVLECTNAGIVAIPENGFHQGAEQRAYGTWDFWVLSHGSAQTVQFISDDSSGTNGYALGVYSNDVFLYKVTAGTPSAIMSTNDNPVTSDAWHHYRVTRRQRDGQFTVYLDGTAVTAATGTNPTVDNTYRASTYLGIDMDAGDKISWSDLTGGHSIMKQDSVVTP